MSLANQDSNFSYSYTALLALFLLFVSSLVYIRRVPRVNKVLVGEGAPFRFLAIIAGQFDYTISILCLLFALYVLF